MLTVFTSAVYPDLARLWYACVTRSFPPDTSFEIFDDSGGALDASWFPRAAVLPRTDSRRDFQESYNDALRRAKTPYLAFIDTDIFWTSPDVWTELCPCLQQRPGLAAISCISRQHRPSHGTFAVVLNVHKYRSVMVGLPDGFLPVNVRFGPDVPMEEWFGYDTGDRITSAVREAGYEVQLRQQNKPGPLVCFESVTMYRRTAERVGSRSLASMAKNSNWLWRGCVSSMLLERLHNRLYPATALHSHRSAGALGLVLGMGPRWPRGLRFTASCLGAVGQVEHFLRSAPPP